MKVAIVCERVEGWRGGAETSTLEFARQIAERGCDVTLVTTSRGSSPPGVKLLTIRASAAFRAYLTAAFERRACLAIGHGGFDIVHAITPCRGATVYEPRGGALPETIHRNIAMRDSAVLRSMKRVTAALNLKYRILARLEWELLHYSPPPVVIAISQYVAKQFRRHYNVPESQLRIIFNGVDPDTALPQRRDADNNDIRQQYDLARHESLALCVAHNYRLKGVGRLIEAVAFMPPEQRRRIRVVIVGRDNPLAYVKLAERLGVSDRIVFAGATQRIATFYHAADMLVHPTYYDPCSRVVLEALGAGVPTITTRFNGAAEVMTDGREGFVLDSPDDVAGLADRMTRLLDDSVRDPCAMAAVKLRDRIGMDRHADEVMRLYREIIEARSCHRSR